MYDVIEVGPADSDLLSFLRASAERSGYVMIRQVANPKAIITYISHAGQPQVYGRIAVLQALARMQPSTPVRPAVTQSYALPQAQAYQTPVTPMYAAKQPSGEVDLTPTNPSGNGKAIIVAGVALGLAWMGWVWLARQGEDMPMSAAERRLLLARSNPVQGKVVSKKQCEYCASKPRTSGAPYLCKQCLNDDPSTCMRCPKDSNYDSLYNWPVGTLLVDPETDDVCCPRHSTRRS